MTYTWAEDDKLIIDHTEVRDSLRGKGVGHKLVAASVEFADNSPFPTEDELYKDVYETEYPFIVE